jgi:transposase
LHQTLHEAAAAIAPAEPELVKAMQESGLLHADATSWPQQDQDGLLWLWVFISRTVVYYTIAGRGKKTILRVLAGFGGWLMSDGWFAYRGYAKRLRCWAHLLRKAHGLMDSCRANSRAFGQQVHDTLERLMAAVYAAREGPGLGGGSSGSLFGACGARGGAVPSLSPALGHPHKKTKALALELYNDWAAIFQVLKHPVLPLTHNEAERALRHWVISRGLSHGTRTSEGSRVGSHIPAFPGRVSQALPKASTRVVSLAPELLPEAFITVPGTRPLAVPLTMHPSRAGKSPRRLPPLAAPHRGWRAVD